MGEGHAMVGSPTKEIITTLSPRPHFRVGTRWKTASTSTTTTTRQPPTTRTPGTPRTPSRASSSVKVPTRGTRRPSNVAAASRPTKPSRRKYSQQQQNTTTKAVESQATTRASVKTDTRYRFVSRKPYFRQTTSKVSQITEPSTDQHIESTNQQEEDVKMDDDTTEWAEIASVLQDIQHAPGPSTKPTTKRPPFIRRTPSGQNLRINASNNYTTAGITIAKVKPFPYIPETTQEFLSNYKLTPPPRSEYVYSTTSLPLILTTSVGKTRTKRPSVPQASEKTSPSFIKSSGFKPIEAYDYYDTIEASILGKIPEHSKVLLHSNGVIECLDQGNFPHPVSCKKFISCAKMETGKVVGWEYTCPKNLGFDPIGGMCNWSAGLGCNE